MARFNRMQRTMLPAMLMIVVGLVWAGCDGFLKTTLDASFVKGRVVGLNGDNPSMLQVKDLQTGERTTLISGSGYQASSMAWVPAGTQILFTRYSDPANGYYLYTMDHNGSNMRRLMDVSLIGDVSISNDGMWIAYTRDFDRELWICRIDGSDPTILANSGYYYRPSFSPDGQRLAFRYGAGALQILNLSTGSIEDVGEPGNREAFDSGHPILWSPDGAMIATTDNFSFSSTIGKLIVVKLETGKTIEVLEEDRALIALKWLPDGDHIIYSKHESDRNHEVHVMDLYTAMRQRSAMLVSGMRSPMAVYIE